MDPDHPLWPKSYDWWDAFYKILNKKRENVVDMKH